VADLAAGRPAEALPRLETVLAGTARFDVPRRAIADHVEAAVRVGDPERARLHLPVLRDWAAATGSPAARALDLRCAALLDGSRQAAELFEEALAGSGPYDRARTLLSYGEWLRRHRRPGAARDRLVAAHETFLSIGALGWTPRVESELRTLGAGLPAPATAPPSGPLALTPQELQVTRLAAQGLTNREIAAHLFLSPRTIGHHLYKAYPKLGIARRAELGQLQL
jgi:DNA-binding CsgD family transcriptional regulator